MINGKPVLGIIPARGGSKGLPGKNLLLAGGRPLIQWSIDAARNAQSIDRLIVSSDDEAIMQAAANCGCEVPFRRPLELASDTAAMIDVVLHAVDQIPGYPIIVLLQPTSPLRTSTDIENACGIFSRAGAKSCVSVAPVSESPYWMYRMGSENELLPVLETPRGVNRRQDLPPVYTINGALYVEDVEHIRLTRCFVTEETVGYVMPRERSIDIDTPADFGEFLRIAENDTTTQRPLGRCE